MKILMIGPSRAVKGGISTVVNNYFDADIESRVDIRYLPTMVDGSKLKKLIFAAFSYIYFFIILHNYSIVHVHMASRASFYRKKMFIRLAKAFNKKVIIHIHGAEFKIFYETESNDLQKKVIREVLNSADKLIVLSASWKSYFDQIVSPEKVEIVYNCVPFINDLHKDYSGNDLIFLGRIGERKGIFDLISIMPDIIKIHPEVRLLIGGDGDTEKLEQALKEGGLTQNVKYIGWVTGKEKEELLEKTKIFILPSYNEGLPMSMLEAMAYKCAVIVTSVGGIPEVIENGVNGYIIEPGDTAGMKECILSLLENQSKVTAFADTAYGQIAQTYSCTASIDKLYKIYNEVGR